MQEAGQAAADVRVAARPLVRSEVGPPERGESRRLRPQAHHLVVVVLQDHPAAGPCRVDHPPDHREGIGHVLQDEAGVDDVKGPPFTLVQGKGEGVPPADLHEPFLCCRRARRTASEICSALCSMPTTRSRGPAARAMARVRCASPQPTSSTRSPPESPQCVQGALVQEIVHQAEAPLFLGRRAVDIP